MNTCLVYSGITNNSFDKYTQDYILNFDNDFFSVSLEPNGNTKERAKQLEYDLGLSVNDIVNLEDLLRGAIYLVDFPYRGFVLSHGSTHRISIGVTPENFTQAQGYIISHL